MQWSEIKDSGSHIQVYKYSTLLAAQGDYISDRRRCEALHMKVLVNLLDWDTQRDHVVKPL